MCYSGRCPHEDHNGDCCATKNEYGMLPCPEEISNIIGANSKPDEREVIWIKDIPKSKEAK